jgi:hypothetical protein
MQDIMAYTELEPTQSEGLIVHEDLAEVMGRKQAGYMNLGLFLEKVITINAYNPAVNKALASVVEVIFHEGETEGLIAGRDYLQEIVDSAVSGEYKAASETVRPVKAEACVVNPVDLLAYAQFSQYWSANRVKSLSSQVWQKLTALYRTGEQTTPGLPRGPGMPLLSGGPLRFMRGLPEQGNASNRFTDDFADLSLGSLMELLAAHDYLKERYPELTTAAILGYKFGPMKVKFLKDFVAYKLDELSGVGMADERNESAG